MLRVLIKKTPVLTSLLLDGRGEEAPSLRTGMQSEPAGGGDLQSQPASATAPSVSPPPATREDANQLEARVEGNTFPANGTH